MAKEATPQRIAGKELVCPLCEHRKFQHRRSLMSRRGLSLLDFEWASPVADTYICERCGYVFWFLPSKRD